MMAGGFKSMLTRAWLRAIYGPVPESDASYGRPVLHDNAGSILAGEVLASGRPALIARFGSTEMACVTYRERWRLGVPHLPYLPKLRENAHVASGIFPTDDDSLDRFADVLLDAAGAADVMGVWHNRSEHRIVERYCPEARLVHLDALNPVIQQDPWSARLRDRTVLVVHPFARSIERQYKQKRTLLFENPEVLPEFELKTYIPEQSVAGNVDVSPSWFDALDRMNAEISEIDFDIAVIGAGAYGLPLGANVKRLGRQAVHLGGNTQLLFGIKGRRWEVESPDIACLFNEHWVRPSADERPPGAEKVEGGCYW